MQLILPKFLLTCLVEKGEIPHMVHKDISQNRKFRINRRNLTKFRLEWGSEASQGCWRVEFGDFALDLTADKLAFQV